MKAIIYTSLFLLYDLAANLSAQETPATGKFGKPLSAGIGLEYYGYLASPTPMIHTDYEFDIAKNLRLLYSLPFILTGIVIIGAILNILIRIITTTRNSNSGWSKRFILF